MTCSRVVFALRNLNLEPGTWNLELGLPRFELPTETASADYPARSPKP